MQIVTISDVHIRPNCEKSYAVWENFLTHSKVKSADKIILLGDIFDLMIGEKRQYLNLYKRFFDKLAELLREGKNVVYIEGNHDFHLESIFKEFLNKEGLNEKKFQYSKDELILEVNGKKTLFCHGDLVDHTNEGFKKWKKVYRSKIFKFLVNRIIPFFMTRRLGERASNNSKKRNTPNFDYEKAKILYRRGAEHVFNTFNCDVIISGHTHIKDHYEIDGKLYLNNGFPQKHMSFIHIEDRAQIISLEGSSE